ncbi:S-adenosyl-L-methionine-dependent methyltransferase [Boletus reticuloceps]|uniref:S-adenosyl-L-methionine-dependent methyltransferase n=1 Tax=Boletus reticuloceps TaxID=495285 RepID=A0A8I2YMI9_9AGAM|nr:S-adenosyl-L-methionine-dependent methyltransferase [Boletus reticuloceps]
MEAYVYHLIDKGLIPDFVLRPVIRALCHARLRQINLGSFEANHAAKMNWIQALRARDSIADVTHKANEQHYEVSTKFILSCLGPYAKYSACLYPTGNESLEEAEILMFESYCQKAQLKDGMHILDLGCGWGSLTVYLAQKYPASHIVGLSNSATQKVYIDGVAKAKNLPNIEIITGDVNVYDFDSSVRFDRILSIEMFEHMKNYELLLRKVASWLRPYRSDDPDDSGPLLFVHIFCHKTTPYHFEESDGWMAQMFFAGGTMPSHDLLTYFQSDMTLIKSWYLSGQHYSRTLEDWLRRQDCNAKQGIVELEEDALSKGLAQNKAERCFFGSGCFTLRVLNYSTCAVVRNGALVIISFDQKLFKVAIE